MFYQHKVLLSVTALSLILLGCSKRDQVKKDEIERIQVELKPSGLYISGDKIDRRADLNISLVKQGFIFRDSKTSSEGSTVYQSQLWQGDKLLLTFYGQQAGSQQSLQSRFTLINVENKEVFVSEGGEIGDGFSQVIDNLELCKAGVEEASGLVICQKSQSSPFYYIFDPQWNGPDSVIPPKGVLHSSSVVKIQWREN
ncbi:DUF1131 domain-containing protein [Vibrio sp. SS-MA-C1-2]|uniref:DUF1131 family protein n=1 Tax=Vibrio sp. SS-MA-C1-2 TaxID=2908646 RepID=UPI001F1B4AFA|nr:DUF1131 family protein [Vibrio sp. SS-MA-C1-2]UJF17488.1 DUF1131 domain-containing protein [Vibrio sp. SS-MA-C1-2]